MRTHATPAQAGERRTEPARCGNCDIEIIEIDGEPVERDGRAFCCEGCAIGGPCVC